MVLRGMAFLGEALAHGMLPGVAVSVLLGLPGQVGALVAAGVMAAGIGVVSRRKRIATDTAIGLLFVGMLALGVIIVSAVRSTPINLQAILFGDILAMTRSDILVIAVVMVLLVAVFLAWYRPFVALLFDPRVAYALGLRPAVANFLLLLGVAVAIVFSYQAVGTLLVVGMLLAPAATGVIWARSVPQVMGIAVLVGVLSVLVGLTVSWHLEIAAGPAIALCAVVAFLVSILVKRN